MKILGHLLLLFLLICHNASAQNIDEVLKDIETIPVAKIPYTPDTEGHDQIKAVQIFVLPKTRQELETLFFNWKSSGINTVILRVFHNEGDRFHYSLSSPLRDGVYYKTAHAPVIQDVLSEIIQQAKPYGFKVFAWMTTRYASYGNKRLPKVTAYSFEQRSLIKAKGMDIFSPDVQTHLQNLYADLAAYPIDGILLQDDLFLKHNEGFGDHASRAFSQEFGFWPHPGRLYSVSSGQLTYTEDFWIWRQWKSKKIADLICNLRRVVKERNKAVKIVTNLTYEAISHPRGALAWLAHDIENLRAVSDYFSVMAYHRQIMTELNLDFKEACEYIADMVKRCHEIFPLQPQRVLFKIQVKDWVTNKAIRENEIVSLVNAAKGVNDLSIAIAPYPPELSISLMRVIFARETDVSMLDHK